MEGEGDTRFRKLYVKNLLFATNVTDLRNFFQQFGTVAEANVVKDRHGKSKGFGFVTFVNPQDAATACQNQFHIIDGRRAYCNLAAFPVQTSQPSSPYRGARMHSGGVVPHPSSSPSVRYPLPYNNPDGSPNYPMYNTGLMDGAGPMDGTGPMHDVPPVYPYDQTSDRNERGTRNTPVTTKTRSNTSQNGRPMYGPRSMTGLPPVYANSQSSDSNGPGNGNNLVTFRSPNNPMHGPGPMYGVPSVYPNTQHSGSNQSVNSNNPMDGPRRVPPVYRYHQASGRNESATGNTPVSIQITYNAAQNGGDRRRGPMLIGRQRQNRR